MRELDGRVAIVTGAAGGIGAAAVRRFLAAGAHVLAVDRDATRLQAPGRASPGPRGLAVLAADLTVAGAAESAVAEAVRRWGALHVLFNVAGGSGRRYGDGPVHACTDGGWDWVMDVNLKTVFRCCRAALPALVAAGGGAIVNLASVLGLVGGGEHFATHAYAAAKAAVIGLTRAMAVHYAPQRVRVNALCPGLVDTPMAARALGDEATRAYAARMQPLSGAALDPDQVAAAALFLASDAAAGITGAVLPVDGGWTAQ